MTSFRNRLYFAFIGMIVFTPICELSAQVGYVHGVILDKTTQFKLEGASVRLDAIDASVNNKSIATISQKNGKFELSAAGNSLYRMSVSHIGYQRYIKDSIRIITGIDIDLKIQLVSATDSILTVTVVSKSHDLEVSRERILLRVSQSAITSSGSSFDALMKMPGVMEMDEKLTFRGQTPNVYLNGRPLRLSGEDLKNYLSNLQASTIESIEILPNPGARYEAIGGAVINIILAKDKNLGTNYNLNDVLSAGTYLRNTIGGDVNYRGKKLTFTAGYNYAVGNQVNYYTNDRFLENDEVLSSDQKDNRSKSNHNYKATVDYDFNKSVSMGFSFNGLINNRGKETINAAGIHNNGNPLDSVSYVNSFNDVQQNISFLNLYLRKEKAGGAEMMLNMDYIKNTKIWSEGFHNTYIDENGNAYIPDSYLRNGSPSNLETYAISVDYSKIIKTGKWEIGAKTSCINSDNSVTWESLQGLDWKVDNTKTNHFIYKENVFAAYISLSGRIKKITYQAGLRAEQSFTSGNLVTTGETIPNNYLNFFPNISIAYMGSPLHPISISYRKSIIRYGFDFVNPFIYYQNIYNYTQGNPYLKPQLNHRFSLSYTLAQGFLSGLDYTHSVDALGANYHSSGQVTISSYDNFTSSNMFYGYLNYNKMIAKVWSTNVNVAGGMLTVDNNSSRNSGVSKTPLKSSPFGTLQMNNTIKLGKQVSLEVLLSGSTAISTGIFERKPVAYTDFGVSRNYLGGKLNIKIGLTDVFNSLNTRTYVDYQGVNMHANVKNESRFLSLNIKYRFGNLNAKKRTERTSKVEELKTRINQ